MPHTPSAWKRLRSSDKRRRRNRTGVKAIKLQARAAADAIKSGDAEAVKKEVLATVKKLDKAANRGLIHKNKAARLKSKMAKKVNAMTAKT